MGANISARKQAQLDESRDNAVNAGVKYNLHYNQFAQFKCEINTEEKRNALVFLLDEQLDNVDMNFELVNVIALMGDPATITTLVYREFKLLQAIISKLTVRTRANAIKFHNAMVAFNSEGEVISALDHDTQTLMKQYQNAAKHYSQLCTNFNVLPDNVDALIEAQLEANNESSIDEAAIEQTSDQ